jgi:hypothetical protein
MTLNWGHKLMLGFLVFAGMMFYLVYQSMHTRYDLVSKEYYKDELKYQQVIDGTNRANGLSSQVTVAQTGNDIIIRLPNEMKNTVVTGNMLFYCADNAQKDKTMALRVNADAIQTIHCNQFIPGNYTVKISWESNRRQYYSEVHITII